MNLRVGQVVSWEPLHWRWDVARDLTVEKLYPRGGALLSNGVIVDDDGYAIVYSSHNCVGRITNKEAQTR